MRAPGPIEGRAGEPGAPRREVAALERDRVDVWRVELDIDPAALRGARRTSMPASGSGPTASAIGRSASSPPGGCCGRSWRGTSEKSRAV
jgi:hypothetical protein